MRQLATLVLFLLPTLCLGQDEKTGDWRTLAAKHVKPGQVEALASQKFVVGDETYKQAFTPYLYSDVPVFVTTDSLLNAFHVLFEESIYRLEKANAARLPA